MTKSTFVPTGKEKPVNKESVFIEYVKNKPTCGEKYAYETADYSSQQKSEYIPKK